MASREKTLRPAAFFHSGERFKTESVYWVTGSFFKLNRRLVWGGWVLQIESKKLFFANLGRMGRCRQKAKSYFVPNGEWGVGWGVGQKQLYHYYFRSSHFIPTGEWARSSHIIIISEVAISYQVGSGPEVAISLLCQKQPYHTKWGVDQKHVQCREGV